MKKSVENVDTDVMVKGRLNFFSSLLASFSLLLQTDMAGCFHSKTEVSLHVSYVSLLYCSWHAVLSI